MKEIKSVGVGIYAARVRDEIAFEIGVIILYPLYYISVRAFSKITYLNVFFGSMIQPYTAVTVDVIKIIRSGIL